MIGQSAIRQIPGRGRLLLFLLILIAPVMAIGLDPGAAAAATFRSLFDFPGGSDGAAPFTPLTQGADGALYGMTSGGGSVGCVICGTVFKLTPPRAPSTQWRWRALHRFSGSDGALGCCGPEGGPALDEDGSLYGTANGNGICFSACNGGGLAFKLTPSRPGDPWKETVLYGFSDFTQPWNPLVEGADGAFYGMTLFRCLPDCASATVFKLTPPMGPGGAWAETDIYSDTPAGSSPNPGLTQFQGAFYYTTELGGNGCGTVSRIVPTPGGGSRNEVLFSSFPASVGCGPMYGVLVEPGIIFGTTSAPRGGSVFALTPPSLPGAQWDLEILHEFPKSGRTDGSGPTGAVVAGKHGVIFGATQAGGSRGCGTVWQLTSPATAGGRWTEKILHDFQGADGCNPASIGPGMGGVLYGTTTAGGSGGSPGNGTVFEIVP